MGGILFCAQVSFYIMCEKTYVFKASVLIAEQKQGISCNAAAHG